MAMIQQNGCIGNEASTSSDDISDELKRKIVLIVVTVIFIAYVFNIGKGTNADLTTLIANLVTMNNGG